MNFPTSITKVEPINKNFKITWFLEKACNFDCSYCSSSDHQFVSGRYKHKPMSLTDMKTYWLRIYHHISKIHKEVDVAFTGGEVTINKNFLPFIKWLTTHFNDILCNIYVTSNGSASTQYYVDLNKYITHLTLSTHMEFINENKFFGTLLKLNNINKSINSSEKLYVQVMEETFYDADKIKVYESFMIMHSIPYIIVEIT